MKIILTGTTGFVGTEVLSQTLQNKSITSIVILSRKPLPESTTKNNPRVTVKILDDFLHYPDSLLAELAGAEGCIWTLGLAASTDLAHYRMVNHEYTLAAVEAFARIPSSSSSSSFPSSEDNLKPFHFIYCSGAAAVRDQEKSLWFMGGIRRIRGQTESALLSYNPESFPPEGNPAARRIQISITRPAMVLAKERTLHSILFSLGPSIRVDRLAAAMVGLVTGGYAGGGGGGGRVLENGEMNE
ncbi:hypothetical protein BJX64DRAFT_285744 [Aspergillus heterothallicus]